MLFGYAWVVFTLAFVLTASVGQVVVATALSERAVGFWPLVAAWGMIPALAAISGIRASFAGQVSRACRSFVLPTAAILAFVYGHFVTYTVRFQFDRHSYERVVADAVRGECGDQNRKRWRVDVDLIDCTNPVTIVFTWAGFGPTWYGVVYDAADEIVKPAAQRSNAWKQRQIGSLLSCSGARAALGDHFFLASGAYTSGAHECG